MIARFLYALLATSVVSGAAWTAGAAVESLPKGPAREAAERWVLAPGSELMERLEDDKRVRKARKKGEKRLREGKEKLEDAAEGVRRSLEDSGGGELDRLTKLYNVGAWAGTGFLLCLGATFLLGVSSLKSALALGVKVTLAMMFLQGALVLGGVFAVAKLAGS